MVKLSPAFFLPETECRPLLDRIDKLRIPIGVKGVLFKGDSLPLAPGFHQPEVRLRQTERRHDKSVFEKFPDCRRAGSKHISCPHPYAVVDKDREQRIRIQMVAFLNKFQRIFTNGFPFQIYAARPSFSAKSLFDIV